MEVYRYSDGDWLEDQDMIRLSGIFRSVYLYSTPAVHLRDFRLDTPLRRRLQDGRTVRHRERARLRRADNGPYTVETQLYDASRHPVWPQPLRQTVELARRRPGRT